LYLTGTDVGTNHPVAYYKPVTATGKWTPFTTTGFPFVSGKKGAAITIGRDTMYCAVNNEIYYYPIGGTRWELGYAYPNGTEINFLFFDDLLAGTGTGLYEHESQGGTTTSVKYPSKQLPENDLVILPNPFTDQVTLAFSLDNSEGVLLRVFNLQGKKVYEQDLGQFPAGVQQLSITLADLPRGLYFFNLQTNSKLRKGVVVKLE
jgi:hypothetical protein